VSCRSLRSAFALVALVAGLTIVSSAAGGATPHLRIPRIGLNVALAPDLAYGPHLYYRTRTTVAIAGHRTTHTHPFRNLNLLRHGDPIWVGRIEYRVRRTVVVRPWQVWVLRYKGLVLSACTPPGSAAYRIVVLAARAN
jgi:sortase (surface protein transpeptidase)